MVDVSNSTVPEQSASPFQLNARTVFVALRYWWKIALPVGLLLAITTTTAICYVYKPSYTAEAWLLIREHQETILRSIETKSDKFIPTEIEIMRSPRIIGPLASNPEILRTPELENEEDVAEAIAASLKVVPRGKSDIYVVSFTSVSPQKAQLVVKEATQSYLAFRSKTESERDSRIVRLLEEQRAARYEEMNQLREKVRALAIQLTGEDPFRDNSKQRKDEAEGRDNPFATMQSDLIKQGLAQDYLAAEIKAEEEIQSTNGFDVSASDVDRHVESHPRYLALVGRTDRVRETIAEYARTAANFESTVAYKKLQSELAENLDLLDKERQELRREIRDALKQQHTMKQAERLANMRREFATNAAKLRILDEKLSSAMEAVQQSAKNYAGTSLDLEFRRAKLEQVTKIHDELQARILLITTEHRAPDRVELFKDPTIPIRPNQLIPWKLVGPGSLLALVLPFGVAIGWEHLFRRVSGRDQLENCHAMTVIGEVTSLPTRTRSAHPERQPLERDVVLFEESVDGLRTYLSVVDSLRDMRVLAISSATSREGKTSLASQLAISIARATNEPTLLLDGDMRSPDVHWIFGVQQGPGLVELLRNECSLDEAIEVGFSEKLHILPAGTLSTSPHCLCGSGEFQRLLNRLLQRYRHIIVDTPPVLPASEAIVMARAADAAILCVRRDFSRMDQVRDAQRRLSTAGVNTIGAVINGIPIQQYAARYGSYGYYDRSR